MVELPPVSLFPGQSDPFLIRWNRACLIPPSNYECFLESGGDAVRTYYRAVTQLTDRFGMPETGTFGKLLSAFWKFQRKSLLIFTEQAVNNGPPTCRVYIDRNWVPSLTYAEADLLNSLGPDQMMPVSSFSLFPAGDHWEAKPGAGFRHGDEIRGWVRGLYRLAPDGIGIRMDAHPYLWKAKDVVGWRGGRWSVVFERKYLQRLAMLPPGATELPNDAPLSTACTTGWASASLVVPTSRAIYRRYLCIAIKVSLIRRSYVALADFATVFRLM